MELRQDQIEDLSVLLKNPRHIHGGEPGTGKTPTICTLQAIRWRRDGIGTVWVMPLKLIGKNYDEAMRWGHWTDGDVTIVDGRTRQVADQLRSGAKLFLMSFTRFASCYKILPPHVKAVDVDEFHKGFGGPDSKRTQALFAFCQKPDVQFVAMTGTLYKGKPDTTYPALQIIEPRYYGTIDLFRTIHHEFDPWTGRLSGYRNLDALRAVVEKHSIKRLWRDIHGAEDKVIQVERVRMSERQLTVYAEFREKAILELEKFFIDGTAPGTAFIRARQIMEHPNAFPDLRDPDHLPPVDICPGETPAKADLLDLDFTNAIENGTPIVVFAALRPQQRAIHRMALAMGLRAGLLNGETTPRETVELDEGFQAGRLNCLVCSPQVADCGYNWQFCGEQEVSDLVFASMDYVDTTFVQAYKRFMRRKRQSALRIKILAYKDSIDEHILGLVHRKSAQAHEVDPDREILIFDHHQ